MFFFPEITPDQKLRIVEYLRDRGEYLYGEQGNSLPKHVQDNEWFKFVTFAKRYNHSILLIFVFSSEISSKCILPYLISSLNGSIRDKPHLKHLILGWKRGASFGKQPSKNTGSGGTSGVPKSNQKKLKK